MQPRDTENLRSEVRQYIVDFLQERWSDDLAVEDDTNLIVSGLVDSIGFIELLGDVEDHFGVEVDLDQYDPAEFTTLSTFTQCVADSQPST